MKPPFARPSDAGNAPPETPRRPRAFSPESIPDLPAQIEPLTDTETTADAELATPPGRPHWLWRIVLATAGLLVSLALGLAADRLIRDLFAAQPWLGYVGLALLVVLLVSLAAIAVREISALMRLGRLDRLRRDAARVIETDDPRGGKAVAEALLGLYAGRADLARARDHLKSDGTQVFDGAAHVRLAEQLLMAQLDARARSLTAASARRVALVTAVSPRALIDFSFVLYESLRLGATIARLYGARPGLMGWLRLTGAILAHLAVTGGLVLSDGVVEQLVGQGLAAKLSARLGEGVVNGLMTVRVGIAAMRVVRPLPFDAVPQPMVRDFIPELANVLDAERQR